RERPRIEDSRGLGAHVIGVDESELRRLLELVLVLPDGSTIRSSFSSWKSKPIGVRRSGCSKFTYQWSSEPSSRQKCQIEWRPPGWKTASASRLPRRSSSRQSPVGMRISLPSGRLAYLPALPRASQRTIRAAESSTTRHET